MKEQDYMNIMGAIRGEYLEEAVSWDGAQRRRIRQIRKMTVSFGAVAASLAVVIGMIAYKANKEKIDTANSDTESSLVEDLEKQQNLFGGHGELHQISGTDGTICYDDDYVYEYDYKWSVRSGGKVIAVGEDEKPANLFMDGKNLFRLHDNKIFETDSFGKETELIDIAAWQFPMSVEADRIYGIQKLSDRLICVEYDTYGQFYTKLICDLQTKKAVEQTSSSYPILFPDTETGYYAVSEMAGIVVRYDLEADGSLTEKTVWESPQNYVGFYVLTVKDQKLYMSASKYDPAGSLSDNDPAYLLTVDLTNGTVTESEIADNSYVYAGTACYRGVMADGAYSIYKSAFDRKDEQRVFSVPVDQYFDTETYGMPELTMSLYESEDMLIVHLPKSVDTIPRPARHGEDGALVDLKTGKVLFYGVNYSLSTPEESSTAESVSTTAVSGTGSALTGTTVTGTGVTTAAGTTAAAKFTVENGYNICGGRGPLRWVCNDYWTDDESYYELGQTGGRFSAQHSADGLTRVKYLGSICRKTGCDHQNESCPLYHYNFEGQQTHPNSDIYEYVDKQIMMMRVGNELWMQRGRKSFRVDTATGDEELMFEITQIDGTAVSETGGNRLEVLGISPLPGAGKVYTGKYLVNCSVTYNGDLFTSNGNGTYGVHLLLVDIRNHTQKLITSLVAGDHGWDADSNGVQWETCRQDEETGDVFVIKNGGTLVRLDNSLNLIAEYEIPVAPDAYPDAIAWCIYDGKMWYQNMRDEWCSFEWDKKIAHVLKQNTGLLRDQATGHVPCAYCDGVFFAAKENAAGQTDVEVFRYDYANSMQIPLGNRGWLSCAEVSMFNGTFTGAVSDSENGTQFFEVNLAEWMPHN